MVKKVGSLFVSDQVSVRTEYSIDIGLKVICLQLIAPELEQLPCSVPWAHFFKIGFNEFLESSERLHFVELVVVHVICILFEPLEKADGVLTSLDVLLTVPLLQVVVLWKHFPKILGVGPTIIFFVLLLGRTIFAKVFIRMHLIIIKT